MKHVWQTNLDMRMDLSLLKAHKARPLLLGLQGFQFASLLLWFIMVIDVVHSVTSFDHEAPGFGKV